MTGRFQVRRSSGDAGPDLWGVYDTRDRPYVTFFTREVLAEAAANRLNSADRAHEARATASLAAAAAIDRARAAIAAAQWSVS